MMISVGNIGVVGAAARRRGGGWWEGLTDLDFANARYRQDGSVFSDFAAWSASRTLSVSVDTDATYFDADGVMRNAAANALRFDHDPATLDSLGLLLEGARTNLRTHSSLFDNAAWSKVRVAVTANSTIAPDGTQTADSVLETAVTNTFHIDSGALSLTTGQPAVLSFFMQKLGRQYVTVDAVNVAASSTFDLDGVAVEGHSGVEWSSAGVQELPNGWRRGWQSFVETASANCSPRLFVNDLASDNISVSHAGDPAKGVIAWGAQFELGAFPSSHIKTSTAGTVVRAADQFTETVSHEASGSVRLYFRTAAGNQGNQVLWQRDDGTENNRIRCVRDSSGNMHWIVSNAGADVVDIDLGPVSELTTGYTDFRWADDDFAASLDGGAEFTDSSGTVPSGLTTIRRGHNVAGTSNWFGHLQREVRGVSKAGTAPFRVVFGFGTDLHYFQAKENHTNRYGREGGDKLAAAIAEWDSRNVDFVLFGGDLVEHYGETRQQALDELDQIVAVYETASAPHYYTLGNHDLDLLTKAEFYAATGMDPTGYYSFDVPGKLHVVVLDGCYDADDDGAAYNAGNFALTDSYVNPAQRTWLASDLAATSLPVLVVCHQWLGGDGFDYVDNAAAVRAILEASGKVDWVLSGHNHRDDFTTINGIRYIGMDYMAEGAFPDNAYAIIEITERRFTVTGFGRQESYSLERL